MTRQCNDVTTHSVSSSHRQIDSRHPMTEMRRKRALSRPERKRSTGWWLLMETGVDRRTTYWWFMDFMMVLNDIIHSWLNLMRVCHISIYFIFQCHRRRRMWCAFRWESICSFATSSHRDVGVHCSFSFSVSFAYSKSHFHFHSLAM